MLIVAGIGAWRGYEYWEAKKAAAAGAAFEVRADIERGGKYAEADAAFAKIAAEAPAGYRTLARFRAAAELAQIKPADAIKPMTISPPMVRSAPLCKISPPCALAC